MVPNWQRVSEALGSARRGAPTRRRLAAAEPQAKRELDTPEGVRSSTDDRRGWLYFHLVLAHAGIARSEATDRALAELRAYHQEHNLWESVPGDVEEALVRFRRLGLRLVVVSNANGTVRAKLERLGLAAHFDHILDSQEEGVEKPDPRLFERALVALGSGPGDDAARGRPLRGRRGGRPRRGTAGGAGGPRLALRGGRLPPRERSARAGRAARVRPARAVARPRRPRTYSEARKASSSARREAGSWR